MRTGAYHHLANAATGAPDAGRAAPAGEAIWAVLRDQSFKGWESFKAVVEDRCGLMEA